MNVSDRILKITIIFYRIPRRKASLCQRRTQEPPSLAETALGKPQATRNETNTRRKWGLIECWGDKNGTTWAATQVGLRPVEAGLGGHDAGVWGSTPGSRTNRYRYQNTVDWHCQNIRPSMGFVGMKLIWEVKIRAVLMEPLHQMMYYKSSFRFCFSWWWIIEA